MLNPSQRMMTGGTLDKRTGFRVVNALVLADQNATDRHSSDNLTRVCWLPAKAKTVRGGQMEIVVALAMLAIFIWIVVAARKVGRQRQPRFTALAEQTRADIEQTLASGRLPSLDDSRIALRRGEVAHLQLEAELMKEVVDREYRGGHRA